MTAAYIMVFSLLFLIITIGTYLNSPSFKGKLGEWVIDKHLKSLTSSGYLHLNDLYFIQDGKTIQVDHVVISLYGIFVIETKNMKGMIKGHERDKNWTQIIYKHKSEFYNPLKQNYGHIKACEKILKESGFRAQLESIVVFPNDVILKTESRNVMLYKDLTDYIQTFEREVYTKDEILRIKDTLEFHNVKNRDVIQKHIEQVNETKHTSKSSDSNVCPRCGGAVVAKKGKYGEFYGCSNYPKCKYTQK